MSVEIAIFPFGRQACPKCGTERFDPAAPAKLRYMGGLCSTDLLGKLTVTCGQCGYGWYEHPLTESA